MMRTSKETFSDVLSDVPSKSPCHSFYILGVTEEGGGGGGGIPFNAINHTNVIAKVILVLKLVLV